MTDGCLIRQNRRARHHVIHIPKANRQRRRINAASTDQVNAVRRPSKVALAIAEDFIPKAEGAEKTLIGDASHFDCMQSVGAGGEELSIRREREQ